MDSRRSSLCKGSLLVFLFFSSISILEANYVESQFSTRKLQTCGKGPNISYPFWIADRQGSYCGLPGFKITCVDDNPSLKISDNVFVVNDIYSNNSFWLTKAELYDEDNNCPAPLHNFSTEGTVFSYGPDTTDLFFLYNCTSLYKGIKHSVDCASNARTNAFAVFHTEVLRRNNYSTESCQRIVNAPVQAESLETLLELNFTGILKKGFVLQWDLVQCRTCQRSGGHCGSYVDGFICYCDGRPHLSICYDVNRIDLGRKIGIGFGVAGFTILVMSLSFYIYLKRYKKRYAATSLICRDISSHHSAKDLERTGSYLGVHMFTYKELEEATNNFDPKNELGDGGFGTVYKGKLSDGRVVAVKRLYESNYKRVEQFMNEVEILTRLSHQNLVSLYGCTSHRCRELLLVYEYISNGTVADHLHGEKAMPGSLTWEKRLNIAVETANALSYLHASEVIHRDVKTCNILLDKNFCVKVADFGLSRLFPNDATHVSTAPQGTPGYVDPEYHQFYQLTNKSDVFSFGVVLIELISSKPAVDITRHQHEINLSNMAINKIQSSALHELVDPCLGFDSDYRTRRTITDVAELAFLCLQNAKDMRPSMKDVLEGLERIQSKDYSREKEEDVPADCSVLSKAREQSLSPISVTAKWDSRSTTPNSSG